MLRDKGFGTRQAAPHTTAIVYCANVAVWLLGSQIHAPISLLNSFNVV